jgi:DNA primase
LKERIPREKIDDVRERTNLVEIVRKYVDLKRAGTGSWKGLCPFHTEKTPSFHVHEARQFFHCFGCGEKGDVFGFLMKIDQRDFMEILVDLAEQAGVELPAWEAMTPAERQARTEAQSERERLLRINELAAAFYEENLAGAGGEAARAYVASRGISAAVAQRFRLGFAPARWDGLFQHLMRNKVQVADIERLGLCPQGERGRYDFFRERVMLPVLDRQRRIIGFGSRLLDPQAKERKYVNSSDSPLFHKKEALYGIHAALEAIRKSGRVILVEGNFDVLALHEAGFAEAVAPMGTALTVEQIALLGRVAKHVVVVFDGDEAGQKAAAKVIPLFVEADVDGRVARLPQGLDPDDLVRRGGGGPDSEGVVEFRRLVEHARPMLDQFIQDAIREMSIPGKVAGVERAAALLARVKNPTARDLCAHRLAVAAGVTPQQLFRTMRQQAEAAARHVSSPAAASARPGAEHAAAQGSSAVLDEPEVRPIPRDELDLLVLLVTFPALVSQAEAQEAVGLLVDPTARRLAAALVRSAAEAGRLDVPTWLEEAPASLRAGLAAATLDGRYAGVPNQVDVLRRMRTRLAKLRIDAEIAVIRRRQEEAEARGDEQLVIAARRRAQELLIERQRLISAAAH